MNNKYGIFTISLDFELFWGGRDKWNLAQYRNNLQGVRKAVPEMLRVFKENNIHATWAVVGFLFFSDLNAIRNNFPKVLPEYKRIKLSPYKYIMENIDLENEYHFAPDIIKRILNYENQEIGTHSFSHYYCLEDGQSIVQFEEDIISAIKVAKDFGVTINSYVFPRNQWNTEYLSTLSKYGIKCFRGNENSWMYEASEAAGQNKVRRAFRFLDAYVNISGYNTYDLKSCMREKPYNFRASRFLRPYSSKLSVLEGVRLRRIENAMADAAINKRIFHLWWHPHNFGVNIKKNIEFLGKILKYYNLLKNNYGMMSLNMGELCLLDGNND